MKYEKIYQGEAFKVLKITLERAESFPLHESKEDAVVFVNKGICKISFLNKEDNIELKHGEVSVIPANHPHQVEAVTDTEISIVLKSDGKISFE